MGSIGVPELPDWLKHTYQTPLVSETGYTIKEQPYGLKRKVKVIFCGMGISGVEFAHQVKETAQNVDVVFYEKNSTVGGTWHENKYPGVACDIPSVVYQFPWDRKRDWTKYYSSADEFEEYYTGIAKKHGLLHNTHFNHQVLSAEWNDDTGKWKVTIMRNGNPQDTFDDYADFFVNGSGTLNKPRYPSIQGSNTFRGRILHSARWDRSLDLKGKKVLVLGIGSSATQLVPSIVEDVDSMFVVARSATWITGGLGLKWMEPGVERSKGGNNFFYSELTKQKFRENPEYYLHYIKAIDAELTQRFRLYLNGTPEFMGGIERTRESMIKKLQNKPELIDHLIPKDFGIGCRRATPGDGFLEALAQDKVSVLTDNIREITEDGFIDHLGKQHQVDVIVYATGFDTSFTSRFPITVPAREKVEDDNPDRSLLFYYGLTKPNFPNYFIYNAPYAPVGHASIIPFIAETSTYILKMIDKVQLEDIKSVEIKLSATKAFLEHADLFLKRTTWTGNCSSWYKSGRKDQRAPMWPGSRVHGLQLLEKGPRWEDYEIKYRSGNEFNFFGNGFHIRDEDGTDTTWFLGRLGDEDKEPGPFTWDLTPNKGTAPVEPATVAVANGH